MKKLSYLPLVLAAALGTGGCENQIDLVDSSVPAQAGTERPAKAAAQATSYSGRAVVVDATVLGITTKLADTGPLPEEGGAEEATLLEAQVPGLLTAEVLHATAVGQGDRSHAEASVANLNLTVGGNAISAGFLMARATAECQDMTASVSGSSEIAQLVVNGTAITVTGEPDQTIELPNGRIIINEQIRSTNGNTGDITVNALHVVVDGIADLVIASAHADIVCQSQSSCSGDFVTGGGWIVGTPSGAKGNFGVGGGIKNGAFWGHLTYIDHGPNGPKVKGTSVTAYVAADGTTRHIEGTARVNGQNGFTYELDVADNGEPGRDDTFTLRLSNGYFASGRLDGGNIQLHDQRPNCK